MSSNTKALLHKIASLRKRLEEVKSPVRIGEKMRLSELTTTELPQSLDNTLRDISIANTILDSTLRAVESTATATIAAPSEPPKLTARGVRILKKSRELIRDLRAISEDAVLQGDDQAAIAQLHRDASAMLDLVPRALQQAPASPSEQMRMCDGLEGVVSRVEEQLGLLQGSIAQRRRTHQRIEHLAAMLKTLACDQDIDIHALDLLADQIVDEARNNQPLRFLYATPHDPAEFAAAHGINTAQVLARILLPDPEWQQQLTIAVSSALVHDVGMARIPADILLQAGPLNDEQRRLLEQHTTIGGEIVQRLWPGQGWPIEGVTGHHERTNGTGYPLGLRDIQISPFARLMAACDVYAALCAARPYRPAFDTRTALTDVLLMSERDLLDKMQAERLLQLSFFPAGNIVELNDGALAVVVGQSPGRVGMTNPSRPVIQLLTDSQRRPLVSPRVIDLVQDRERSILRALNRDERNMTIGHLYPELV